MALFRIDGWDYLPVSTGCEVNALADGWYGNTVNIATSLGRFGSGLALGQTGLHSGGASMYEAVGNRFTTETVVMGQAFYLAQGNGGLWQPFQIGAYDGEGGNGDQWVLQWEEDGVFRLYIGGTSSVNKNGLTLVATSHNKVTHVNEWDYIEVKWLIHPTAGMVEVRVNTVTVISYLGRTGNLMPPLLGADYGWDTLQYSWRSSYNTTLWDDRYILDDTGVDNIDYLGNVRVNAQLTTAPGDLTQMSVFGAAANWDAVNERVLTEVEYVYDSVMTHRDLYTMDPNVTAQNILGVQVVGAHRQDDSTQLKSKLSLKTGGTIYDGVDHYLAQSYHYYRDIWDINPNTGVGWTAAELNAIQAGQQVLLG
jgi:hypothetical protein